MGRPMKHPKGGYRTREQLVAGLKKASKTKTGYIPFEQWPRKLQRENKDLVEENLRLIYGRGEFFIVNWALVEGLEMDEFEKLLKL